MGSLRTVPRTDTGALGEKPKVCRVYPVARELGKLAPYPRKKGCLRFWLKAGTAGRSGKGVPAV